MRGKKGQEEMVGFVLIIVLVSIIVLIFLAISMRKPVEMQKNKEIENFLYSSLLYTSDCYESPEIIDNLKGLIKACSDNKQCMDEREACAVLEETVKEVIGNSWVIGENSVEKAYVFRVYDEKNDILYLTEGEETSTKTGAEILIEGENLYISMDIFY